MQKSQSCSKKRVINPGRSADLIQAWQMHTALRMGQDQCLPGREGGSLLWHGGSTTEHPQWRQLGSPQRSGGG